MSSEQLGSGVNILKGDLAASFDILSGSAASYQDLGIARRFGGAAAAYSLRDIGAMNGRVVKVRRDVDGDGTDKEEDFSANQVASGALEDWVNGKLENTLPADVATAAAAYSLRKVSSTQVAFNQTSFPDSSSLDFFKINVGSGATFVANTDGYQTKNDLAKFTVTGTDILVQFKIDTESYKAGRTGSTTFEYYIESDSPLVGKYWHIGSRNNQYSTQGVQIVGGAWTTATVSFSDKGVYESQPRFLNVRETESGGDAVTMSSTDTNPFIHFSSVSVNITDFSVLRIRRSSDQLEVNVGLDSDGKISNTSPIGNISEEGGDIGSTTATTLGDFISGTDAFVHTWYDQAGLNNATQDTDGDQPKIAENGALLADGINFDSDFLTLSSTLGATSAISISTVYKYDTTVGFGPIFDNRDSGLDGCGLFMVSTKLRFTFDGTNADALAAESTTDFALATAIHTGSNISLHKNSVQNVSTSDSDTISVTSTPFIGRNFSGTNKLQGNIKELIIYNSDQTDNRFKIESNINNYYSLYNVNGDGFVETWYDQSGNGNDATQISAQDQPQIVVNGGQVTETQGKPAIQFSTSKEFLLISTTNLQSLFSVVSSGDVAGDEQTIIANDGVNNKYVRLLSGGTDYNPIVKNGAIDLTFADLASEEQEVGIIFVYNRTDANNNTVHINNSAKAIISGTDTDLNADIDVDRIGTRNNNLDPWAGKMQEIIVFDKDMSSDRTDLQNDMANFYNITLS